MNITEIIDALNVNGRQGPQSLLSQECYNWVAQSLVITPEEYTKVIEENTIDNEERGERRDGCFVRQSNGTITLFKSTEEELRPFVCQVISQSPSPLKSPEIIKAVKSIYPYMTPVDIMIQKNISSPQMRIDQTIRNILVSNYIKKANNILFFRSESKPYTFTLKEEGKKLAMKAMLPLKTDGNEPAVSPEAKAHPVLYYNKSSGTYSRPATDPQIAKAVIKKFGCRCAIDEGHITFEGKNGMDNFVQAHHLIPLEGQYLLPHINLDIPENILPLCPNCHSAVHYGSKAVRQKYLSILLKKSLPGLEKAGIAKELAILLIEKLYEL